MKRLAFALIFVAPVCVGAAPPATAIEASPRNLAVFDRVCALVDKHYWNDDRLGDRWIDAQTRARAEAAAAPDARALYRVINRMLDAVGDSHVFAVDPIRHAFETDRRRRDAVRPGAFGFSTWQQNGVWRVFAVEPGGAAARGGVMIGWRLTMVNGRPVDEDWHPEVGGTAVLEFLDDAGRTRRLTLTAGVMADDGPGRATRLADGTLVARIDAFEPGVETWLRAEIAAERPRALILDLRENGGGEAMTVARVAGLFFAEKRTLIEQVRRGKPLDVPILGAGRRGGWDGPLAVLVGSRSASGAEALAAMIEETGRGLTAGERTAGALTGAVLFDLPDGGQLSVAEFDIRTGGGRRLEGVGFTPHLVVRPAIDALRRGEDPVAAAASHALAADDDAGSERVSMRSRPVT